VTLLTGEKEDDVASDSTAALRSGAFERWLVRRQSPGALRRVFACSLGKMSIDFEVLCRKKELMQTQTLNGDLFAMSGVLVLLPTLHVIMTHECPYILHDTHACMNALY
jgi:hypothetical protein